jgi:hypothetical protein
MGGVGKRPDEGGPGANGGLPGCDGAGCGAMGITGVAGDRGGFVTDVTVPFMATRGKRKTAEHKRLEEARAGKKWRRWGTYLSERQWGTVREDYSANGDAWSYFSYEEACVRAYRWGEDGLLGFCDNRGIVQFALALWNGKDPILKERLFGVTGPEGNHGEDVKELYYYVDATPTHSYQKALYKYPHAEFPYEALRRMAREAGRGAREPEIAQTGVFDRGEYFDVSVEYAKADVEDVLVRITVTNRGPAATLELLPTLWFRNTWRWNSPAGPLTDGPETEPADQPPLPRIRELSPVTGRVTTLLLEQEHLGKRWLHAEGADDALFTENESNADKLWGSPNLAPFTKDAFHETLVSGEKGRVNPDRAGTKAALRYKLTLAQGATVVTRLRLSDKKLEHPFEDHDAVFEARIAEADEFYAASSPPSLTAEQRAVYRQAMAGLIWSKQYYHLDIDRWLRGDPAFPAPPEGRKRGRNRGWLHLYNSEVLSVPDKWEYPWYAAWDLAFHMIPFSLVDPDFAKQQLTLLLREWYMHPNGELPAYEWAFGDVNPPVHAWAALRVYQIDRRDGGSPDRAFLEGIFHKLILNFTWWVNRKDAQGNNVFEGGFLGLDNIGVFDRSTPLPGGGMLEQADATSWMGMYCLNLLKMAIELSRENPMYQDVATKFFEHFLFIAHAMSSAAPGGSLWDEEDGFFYDVLRYPDGASGPLKVRSMVGIIPLFAVDTLEPYVMERLPAFVKRMRWFIENRPELAKHVAGIDDQGSGGRRLLSLLDRRKLVRILSRVLDEKEFLSPYGVRALSRAHKDHPYVANIGGTERRVDYEPAESSTGMFGGNSNWRGPIWFPVNYLLIESLQKYHHYYGDDLRVECPTGSGHMMTLWEVAAELSARLTKLFLRGPDGRRPADGPSEAAKSDPAFKDFVTFYEYFHGDTGEGLGASHQTGWTALVAKLLQQSPLWKREGSGSERL